MPYANANQDRMLFISNLPQTRRYNFLNYVMDVSEASTRVTIDNNTFLFGPGKKRRAVLNYYAPDCDPEGTCGQGLCDAGEAMELRQEILDITKCFASKKYAFYADALRLVDNQWTFTEAARQQINAMLPELNRRLSLKMLGEVYMLAGTHADGSEYGQQKLRVVDLNTGVVNPAARLALTEEYLRLGYQDPYILGGKDVFYWQRMQAIGGLNQFGQNIAQVDTNRTYYDDGLSDIVLNDVVNGGHILTIDPQVFKMVTYLKNAGMFRGGITSFDEFEAMRGTTAPDWGRTTFLDNTTGLVWDLYINYDKCDDVWTWHVEINYDFFVLPDGLCNIEGINGIMKWRTCPEVIADCPTGSPITSPGSGSLYSWTPGSIFPKYIATATIGSINTEPKVTVTSLADLAAMMNANYAADIFSVSGSDIVYTGFTAIEGSFNEGEIDFAFSL